MYETILLPTDGSENAQLATERAIDTAARHDATLHVQYVVEMTQEDPTQTSPEEKLTKERKEGEDVIEAVEQQATEAGVETGTNIERGVPRTTIEEYAGEYDIDLITISSTGASGVSEKLLGTVAKYIVNEAPADVLIVRHDEMIG